jgi:hypothetical protein
MINAAQIRAMVEQLTLSKISLDDFEDWFSVKSWNAHLDDSPEAAETLRLIGRIELCLAEDEEETRPYEELLGRLQAIVGVFWIGQVPASPASSGTVRKIPFSFQYVSSADADKRSSAGLSYTPLLPA